MKVKYCVVRFKKGKPKLTYLQGNGFYDEKWTKDKLLAEHTVEHMSNAFPSVHYVMLAVPTDKIMNEEE